MEKLLF